MENLEEKILEVGLKKLEKLKAKQHQLDVEICTLRYQVQDVCPHKIEDVVEGAPIPRAYDYQEYMPPFRVCKKCGYAEFPDPYGRFSPKISSTTILQIRRDEAHKFIRGHIYNTEAVEKMARDRKVVARAEDYARTIPFSVPPIKLDEAFRKLAVEVHEDLDAIERAAKCADVTHTASDVAEFAALERDRELADKCA